MTTIAKVLPKAVATGIGALGIGVMLTLSDLGTGSAAAENRGGYELTIERPTGSTGLPAVTAGPAQKTGMQVSPRSKRKNWSANSNLPVAGHPYRTTR